MFLIYDENKNITNITRKNKICKNLYVKKAFFTSYKIIYYRKKFINNNSDIIFTKADKVAITKALNNDYLINVNTCVIHYLN